MFTQLMDSVDIIYHYTKKSNVESIKKDRQLKKFKDSYVFVCRSYEDCIKVIQGTILNPKARYVDFDYLVKKYNVDIKDLVILKLKVRYADNLKWYKSNSAKDSRIDNLTIAYKGNIPIDVLDVIEIGG